MAYSDRSPEMWNDQHRACNWLARPTPAYVGTVLVVALAVTLPTAAVHAYSFSLAAVAGGDHAPTQLNSALKGILLTTQERDGHTNETSDGSPGRLEVFIVPSLTHAAESIRWLKRTTQTTVDIVLLLSSEAGPDQQAIQMDLQTDIVRPGAINANPIEASRLFSTWFQPTYGRESRISRLQKATSQRSVPTRRCARWGMSMIAVNRLQHWLPHEEGSE